jgi:hypothetical protein
MYKLSIALLACLPLLIALEGCGARKAQRSPNSVDSKTIHLFNGKTLDGWYSFIQNRGKNSDLKHVFTVQNGLIHVSGEEYGSIISDKEYSNYKLNVEFKWGEKTYSPRVNNARDNGVLIHSTGEDGGYNGIWMHSIECQIIEGGTGDFLVVGDGTEKFSLSSHVAAQKQNGTYIFQPDGSLSTIYAGRINWFGRDAGWEDVKGFRGANDIEKPAGEWNTMEIIAEKDKVSIILNGTLVNQALNVLPSKGHIQLQSEGAEIFFRQVDITSLATK